jgi:hypothetical protein
MSQTAKVHSRRDRKRDQPVKAHSITLRLRPTRKTPDRSLTGDFHQTINLRKKCYFYMDHDTKQNYTEQYIWLKGEILLLHTCAHTQSTHTHSAHTRTCAHTHNCTCTHKHAHVHTRMHTNVHIQSTHTHSCAHTCTYMNTCTRTHTPMHICTQGHAHTCTHEDTHTRAHAHTYTCAHMHAQDVFQLVYEASITLMKTFKEKKAKLQYFLCNKP